MGALTHEIETLIARAAARRRPGAGDDRGRPVGDAARRPRRRRWSGPTARWRWPTSSTCRAVRLAALVEKGSALTERPQTAAEGRAMLAGLVDEAEKAGEWVLAARALNNLVQGVPPTSPAEHAEMLERMRVDAERAGFESLAVAAYFQGRARLAMREGDLRAAIAALEQGRDRDRGYRRRGRRADYHAVFLAGLYLEAGELDRVEQIIADLRGAAQSSTDSTIPGLAFHLACRRGDLGARRGDPGRGPRRRWPSRRGAAGRRRTT